LLKPGNVSLIVQSGMLSAGFLMMILDRGGMGIAKICSIGNKCDIHEGELLEYLIADPETDVIGLYVESIVNAPRFMDLCKSTNKPVVILKGGQSPAGAMAAQSHTASMAGNYTLMSHAFRQVGIIEVFDANEFTDLLRGFSKISGYKDTGGTAIITFSGAGGIITSDLLYNHGLPAAELSLDTLTSLQEVFPEWMPPSHPVDIWPAIERNGYKKVYTHVIKTLMHDDNVNSLILHMLPNRMDISYLEELAPLKNSLGKPVIAWLTGTGKRLVDFRSQLEDIGIPVFEEMGRGVRFLQAARQHFDKKA
jgi:acyl-CoA synthetase (NDP forming)